MTQRLAIVLRHGSWGEHRPGEPAGAQHWFLGFPGTKSLDFDAMSGWSRCCLEFGRACGARTCRCSAASFVAMGGWPWCCGLGSGEDHTARIGPDTLHVRPWKQGRESCGRAARRTWIAAACAMCAVGARGLGCRLRPVCTLCSLLMPSYNTVPCSTPVCRSSATSESASGEEERAPAAAAAAA